MDCNALENCDFNYLRHVGWSEDNECIKKFYSKPTIKLISKKVSELTKGVDPLNRTIVVPDYRICEVMDGVRQGYRPTVGDIFTRYIIPNNEQADVLQSLIDQTIEIIVSNIKNSLGMEQENSKLSAWVQVYGDFNPHNLRQHSIIKTRERRPATMQFHMNY
jgi:hypothetical protein